MKEPLESSPTESAMQDKKNYASESADKIISANNSRTDSTTIADKKQSRIATTVNFFPSALRQNHGSTLCLPVDKTARCFFFSNQR